MKCNISKSKYYGTYCKKRKCIFYVCSQLIEAHRKTLGEVVRVREENER